MVPFVVGLCLDVRLIVERCTSAGITRILRMQRTPPPTTYMSMISANWPFTWQKARDQVGKSVINATNYKSLTKTLEYRLNEKTSVSTETMWSSFCWCSVLIKILQDFSKLPVRGIIHACDEKYPAVPQSFQMSRYVHSRSLVLRSDIILALNIEFILDMWNSASKRDLHRLSTRHWTKWELACLIERAWNDIHLDLRLFFFGDDWNL